MTTATPDAAPVSDEDRLAAVLEILGDEGDEAEAASGAAEGDPDPADGAGEAPPTFKVKVNGREVEVTLDEALRGYSRTEDYKAKTAELAREREALARRQAAAETERDRYAEGLNRLAAQAAAVHPVLAREADTDWERLAAEDPAGFAERRQAWEAAHAQVEAWRQEAAAHAEHQARAHLAREDAALAEKLPEWGDQAARAALAGDLRRYLQGEGFTADELGRLADHRSVLVARKAMLYDRLMADRQAAEGQKARPASGRSVPPGPAADGASVPARVRELDNRARRTGRFDHRLGAVLARL